MTTNKITIYRQQTIFVLRSGTMFTNINGDLLCTGKDITIRPIGWFTRFLLKIFPRWPYGQSVSVKVRS
jgi:hypothetical protein